MLLNAPLMADDTELFVKDLNLRPQVLIIFDSSGSMKSEVASDPAGRSRTAVAKEAITTLIEQTPNVDFGLAVFNGNDGSRIIDKVEQRDDIERAKLINSVNGIRALGNTPLCESLYEAYLYYTGKQAKYALYGGPTRDTSAESPPGKYISPLKYCHENVYIILMTDGSPNNDDTGHRDVATLTGATSEIHGSYMPHLAQWMQTNDVITDPLIDRRGAVQKITTYTIGFGGSSVTNDDSTATKMLKQTALLGGGKILFNKHC